VGLALQLGGALGNLIDRVIGGYVIDFLSFSIWPPVFNLADSAIVVGIGLFVIAFWRDFDFREDGS
ncbi:MAG: signal peptidase II, partial [Bacillota bacterium]